MKILKILLICGSLLLFIYPAEAQNRTAPDESEQPDPSADRKNNKSAGSLLLKLGNGLLNEVKRRLNLEEAEIITVTKEELPDGGRVYHVDTGKFSFDIRKKNKSNKDKNEKEGNPPD